MPVKIIIPEDVWDFFCKLAPVWPRERAHRTAAEDVIEDVLRDFMKILVDHLAQPGSPPWQNFSKTPMREDVHRFAVWMAEAMDSKRIERESRDEPHYMHKSYALEDALARLQDKTDQLTYDASWRPEDFERVKKTAVHLANFCMIIARKVEADHRVSSPIATAETGKTGLRIEPHLATIGRQVCVYYRAGRRLAVLYPEADRLKLIHESELPALLLVRAGIGTDSTFTVEQENKPK